MPTDTTSFMDFTALSPAGQEQPFSAYAGKVVLVVNTASHCGFTPQYAGLEELYQRYADQGLVVLGFPCNQFGGQAPGTGAEEVTFCQRNYGVTFPMFGKVDVNGRDAHPLFVWLRSQRSGLLGGKVRWNFTKFLVGRDGRVIDRFAPSTPPAKLVGAIERAL